MNHRTLAVVFLVAASLVGAEPADHLFPADKDGAPAPLAPLDASKPQGAKEPRRELGRPLREKVEQLKAAGMTREDMQRIRAALEKAREDDAVKSARQVAEAAHAKLRDALRAYAEAHGVQAPEPVAPAKVRGEGNKDKPDLTPEQIAERRAHKQQEMANRKPDISPEKLAEVRKVMESARNDPAVKAAFEEARAAGEALREAVKVTMLKADPSLAPLIDKLGDLREAFREEHPGFKIGGQDKRPGPEGDGPNGPAMEKVRSPKLAAALEAANGDESVKAARKAAEEAKNKLHAALEAYAESHGLNNFDKADPEAVAAHRKAMEEARNDPAVKAAFEEARAAGEAFHAALKDAVLKADPSLAAEFENSRPAGVPKVDKRVPQKQPGA